MRVPETPVVRGSARSVAAMLLLIWMGGCGQKVEGPTQTETVSARAPVESEGPPVPPENLGTDDKPIVAEEAPEPLKQAASWKAEAVASATEVVRAYPDQAIAHALLGSAHYNIGQSEEAAVSLRRCLELDPRQSEAYEMLARIAYDRGELEEVVRLCEQGIESGGANPPILIQLGRAQLDLGQAQEAIEAFQQALQFPGPSSETFYLMGQACLQAGDPARAMESFQKALQLIPDHTQALFGAFTAATRLGDSEDARRYRESFLKQEALDRQTLTDRSGQDDTLSGLPLVRRTVARTFFGAGQIHLFHKQRARGEALLLKAAAIDPEHVPSRSALETIMVRRDAVEEAVSVFQQLVDAQPDNPLNYLALGRLNRRLEQVEGEETAFQKALELAPEDPEGYRGLIELYLKTNKSPPEVRKLAERLAALEPGSGSNLYLLAYARVRTGDRAGAIQAMEEAVRLNPENGRYLEFLHKLREAP